MRTLPAHEDSAGRWRAREGKFSVVQLQILFLVGIFLASGAPAAAQNSLPRASLAPSPSQTRTSGDRPAPASSSMNFSRSSNAGRAALSLQSPALAGAYKNSGIATILPLPQQVVTLFASQSMIPLAAFGKGRFGLEGFSNTIHMSNVELGPSGAGGLHDFRPPRHYQLSDPRALDSYGISIKLHLRRDSRVTAPAEFWRHVGQLFDEIR